MSLTHAFVSAKADGTDTTKLRPSNWNADHVFGGGALGSLIYRDTGASDGASWLADVAAGSVLVSGGVGVAPAWSASPTLASLTLTALSTAIAGVVFKGASRFIHNYADATARGYNTFVGVSAGNFTMSPAGGSDLLASYNTGVGESVLGGLTTGYSNTAMGISALGQATTGYFNTAIGADAMAFAVITGVNNTAIGGDALYSTTSGVNNSGLGVRTMWYTQDGDDNVALGFDSLYTNVSGDKNVALGNTALYLATGSNNIAIGYGAGDNITTASGTITIGHLIDADSASGWPSSDCTAMTDKPGSTGPDGPTASGL